MVIALPFLETGVENYMPKNHPISLISPYVVSKHGLVGQLEEGELFSIFELQLF